ncbi:MAG: FAD:protein FMN transferase [Verrucomicrobia bacterium]|nr:FAD:protein FMN transferase [Verrucomicrobiota bacterium]MCF7707735.1 FAD:protein FMN transferase [Verrucomicrobiota bacterium]
MNQSGTAKLTTTPMTPKVFRGITRTLYVFGAILLFSFQLSENDACAGNDSRGPVKELKRFTNADLHMGTMFQIVIYAPDQKAADSACEKAFRRVKELDRIMSDYYTKSELNKLCAQPVGEAVHVSEDMFNILEFSQQLASETDGAFDVTIGPLIQLWRESKKTKALPTTNQVQEAMERSGYEKLKLNKRDQTVTLEACDMRIDLGGIAKGYAADAALKVLKELGYNRSYVAAGGDLALADPPPNKEGWAIGIRSIDADTSETTRTIHLKNAAISTSGDTEQYVEIDGVRYSHIVNPKTGIGLRERIGVTIIAPNATISDSYATAVSILDPEKGIEFLETHPDVAALIVMLTTEGKKVITTDNFRDFIEPIN